MPAERTLNDATVGMARPGQSPVVEQQDFLGAGLDELIDDVLISEEVRALNGVPGVEVEVVALLFTENSGGAAFGADGVRPHELHLGDDADVDGIAGLTRDFDSRAQSSQTRAEDHHIMIYGHAANLYVRGNKHQRMTALV